MNDEVCSKIRKVIKSFKRYKIIAFSSMLLILTTFKFLPVLIENNKDLVENLNNILSVAVFIPLFFIGLAFYTEVKKFKSFKNNKKELKHIRSDLHLSLNWIIFEAYFGAAVGFIISVTILVLKLKDYVSVIIAFLFLILAVIHELLSDKHEIKIIDKILNE